MTRVIQNDKTVNTAESSIASKMVLDFNARGYPEVKSEGFKGNFAFLFGSNGRNKSRLAVKNLRDTHATRAPGHVPTLYDPVRISRKVAIILLRITRIQRKIVVTSSTMKLRRISALGRSTDLRQLPELNFIQLYDYLVVSTRRYRHIVFKGANYKKLKSYQFCFEGKVKRLESKTHENETYVKTSVLPSMKKSPYRVLLEFTPQCDVSRAACTCPAGLGSQGKGKCNHIGGVLFALEDFTRRGQQKYREPLSCTSRLSVWVVLNNQSIAAEPLDQILPGKIRFWKKNIRLR